ncbi:MAG: hypothetical protein GW822_11405 [Sphingomonadales bacterium]|nr:hypothetical protein [Sphingomonadales bacterium]NCP44026.1 hypothetical protein [Sphingomonadales bacterium]
MIKLEDGHAINMGDTFVIEQKDATGAAQSVVVTPADLEALMGLKGPHRAAMDSL